MTRCFSDQEYVGKALICTYLLNVLQHKMQYPTIYDIILLNQFPLGVINVMEKLEMISA